MNAAIRCRQLADTSPRTIQLSRWQRNVAGLAQSVDELHTLVLAGGRGGGGKSGVTKELRLHCFTEEVRSAIHPHDGLALSKNRAVPNRLHGCLLEL